MLYDAELLHLHFYFLLPSCVSVLVVSVLVFVHDPSWESTVLLLHNAGNPSILVVVMAIVEDPASPLLLLATIDFVNVAVDEHLENMHLRIVVFIM